MNPSGNDYKANKIPESIRADGSVRKQRNIKRGHKASEDHAKFESTGTKYKREAEKKYGKIPGLTPK